MRQFFFNIVVLFAIATCVLSVQSRSYAEDSALNELRFPEEEIGDFFKGLYRVRPKYVPEDLELEITPPPANDSAETEAELALLKKYEAEERSLEIVALIVKEHEEPIYDSMVNQLPDLPVPHREDVEKLVFDVGLEVQYFLLREKIQFMRPRPIHLVPDLTMAIEMPGHPAYPSGHAGVPHIHGLFFAEIDPEHKEEYIAAAYAVGHRRELAGVHYPSDTAEGISIAEQVFAVLKENEEFKAKMDKVSKAIREDH